MLSFFLCLWPVLLTAQQPSYQVVGGDFLEGKDVYALLEGKDKRLWIGTDEGLFVYNGESFKGYDNPNLKNNSVFSLCENSQGVVYYTNFSGQVMRVVKDSLEVYYELPDSLMGKGIDLKIDDQEAVVIFCKQLVKIDQEKKLQVLYDLGDYTFAGRLVKRLDNSISVVLGYEQIIATWKEGKLTCKPYLLYKGNLEQGTLLEAQHPELYYNGQEEILIGRSGTYFLQKEGKRWQKTMLPKRKDKLLTYFFTQSKDLWLSQRDKGAFRYAVNTKKMELVRLFPDYHISYYLDDSEGNLWLGTFKKGLLRIPHLEVRDFRNNTFVDTHLPVCLSAGNGDTLYAMTTKGLLYQIDQEDQVTTLFESKINAPSYLQYVPWTNCLYFDNTYYNLRTQQTQPIRTNAVKNVQLIPPNNLFFTDYVGIYIYSANEQPPTLEEELEQYRRLNSEKRKQSDFQEIAFGRVNQGHFQASFKRFWMATNKQLLVLEEGDSLHISYKGRPVIATALASWEDTTYVATANGLLQFVGTNCKGFLTKSNAPLLRKIRKMDQQNGLLYLIGVGGFQCVNLKTGLIQTLDVSDGILSNKILDFALLDNNIALLTSQGLQKVSYQVLEKSMVGLKAKLAAVYKNGIAVDPGKEGQFKYFEKELEVVLEVPYLRDRTTLTYYYRLLGLGEEWNELPVSQNRILYNSLSSGRYSLEIQVRDSKRYKVPITHYEFTIALPFWETWWFISACILGIILLVSLFFWVRINILKQQNALLLGKKAIEKQLVESQQTALRSQMNPHFLFNALNSIQEMIIVNDKNAASNYLGKFADLMRLYLNQSQEERVTLAEELEALQLYLELEQVRFEESLEVELKVMSDLSPDELTLPPMLVQPYVENAFKHGLLHKAKDRQLYVEFSVDFIKQQLRCLIRDNGVGRARSAEIKNAQIIPHTSFASSATQRRLELLNYNRNNLITVTIEDLVGEKGQGIGTAVYLCVPLDWEG
ncbi:MAG: histidine kinase [Aureispira sp.]